MQGPMGKASKPAETCRPLWARYIQPAMQGSLPLVVPTCAQTTTAKMILWENYRVFYAHTHTFTHTYFHIYIYIYMHMIIYALCLDMSCFLFGWASRIQDNKRTMSFTSSSLTFPPALQVSCPEWCDPTSPGTSASPRWQIHLRKINEPTVGDFTHAISFIGWYHYSMIWFLHTWYLSLPPSLHGIFLSLPLYMVSLSLFLPLSSLRISLFSTGTAACFILPLFKCTSLQRKWGIPPNGNFNSDHYEPVDFRGTPILNPSKAWNHTSKLSGSFSTCYPMTNGNFSNVTTSQLIFWTTTGG